MATNLERLLKLASKNSTTLLTGAVVLGVFSTSVLAGKATLDAYKVLQKEDMLKARKKDIIKKVWPHFIAPAVVGGVTITCAIYSNKISARRNAALVGLLTLTEASAKEYKDKVVEVLGKKKEEKIQEEVYKEKIEKNPPTEKNTVVTGKGDTLCMEAMTGRYFKSDIAKVRTAEIDANRLLRKNETLSLNDVLYLLGLEDSYLGDEFGWTIDDNLEWDPSSILTSEGIPCYVLDYSPRPYYEYKEY